MELVSVIIPCYNQGEYLYECLQSVFNQTYKNIEIIIVNDGSNDDLTNEILNEFRVCYKHIKILSIENSGVCNARNIGVDASHGEYILPLDADDKIDKYYIEKTMNVFGNKRGIDIVYSICRCFGDKNQLLALKDFSIKNMLMQNRVFCSAIFRKQDFYKAGKYNVNMKHGYEDWDFWLSMIELNKKFYRINDLLFYYRIKTISRNSTVSKDVSRSVETIKQIYFNHLNLYKKYNIDLEQLIKYNTKKRNCYQILIYIYDKIKINIILLLNKFKKS